MLESEQNPGSAGIGGGSRGREHRARYPRSRSAWCRAWGPDFAGGGGPQQTERFQVSCPPAALTGSWRGSPVAGISPRTAFSLSPGAQVRWTSPVQHPPGPLLRLVAGSGARTVGVRTTLSPSPTPSSSPAGPATQRARWASCWPSSRSGSWVPLHREAALDRRNPQRVDDPLGYGARERAAHGRGQLPTTARV